MASLIPSGSTSGTGSMTLAAPVTNSNQTATLPDATGTVMVSGNMPAFAAYASAGQSIATATITKVAANTKEFDTATCYDITNYRFTPNVAGYYQINTAGWWSLANVNQYINHFIYKNGSQFKQILVTAGSVGYAGTQLSTIMYLNGTTDYVEFYVSQSTGSSGTLLGSQLSTIFSGALVRAA